MLKSSKFDTKHSISEPTFQGSEVEIPNNEFYKNKLNEPDIIKIHHENINGYDPTLAHMDLEEPLKENLNKNDSLNKEIANTNFLSCFSEEKEPYTIESKHTKNQTSAEVQDTNALQTADNDHCKDEIINTYNSSSATGQNFTKENTLNFIASQVSLVKDCNKRLSLSDTFAKKDLNFSFNNINNETRDFRKNVKNSSLNSNESYKSNQTRKQGIDNIFNCKNNDGINNSLIKNIESDTALHTKNPLLPEPMNELSFSDREDFNVNSPLQKYPFPSKNKNTNSNMISHGEYSKNSRHVASAEVPNQNNLISDIYNFSGFINFIRNLNPAYLNFVISCMTQNKSFDINPNIDNFWKQRNNAHLRISNLDNDYAPSLINFASQEPEQKYLDMGANSMKSNDKESKNFGSLISNLASQNYPQNDINIGNLININNFQKSILMNSQNISANNNTNDLMFELNNYFRNPEIKFLTNIPQHRQNRIIENLNINTDSNEYQQLKNPEIEKGNNYIINATAYLMSHFQAYDNHDSNIFTIQNLLNANQKPNKNLTNDGFDQYDKQLYKTQGNGGSFRQINSSYPDSGSSENYNPENIKQLYEKFSQEKEISNVKDFNLSNTNISNSSLFNDDKKDSIFQAFLSKINKSGADNEVEFPNFLNAFAHQPSINYDPTRSTKVLQQDLSTNKECLVDLDLSQPNRNTLNKLNESEKIFKNFNFKTNEKNGKKNSSRNENNRKSNLLSSSNFKNQKKPRTQLVSNRIHFTLDELENSSMQNIDLNLSMDAIHNSCNNSNKLIILKNNIDEKNKESLLLTPQEEKKRNVLLRSKKPQSMQENKLLENKRLRNNIKKVHSDNTSKSQMINSSRKNKRFEKEENINTQKKIKFIFDYSNNSINNIDINYNNNKNSNNTKTKHKDHKNRSKNNDCKVEVNCNNNGSCSAESNLASEKNFDFEKILSKNMESNKSPINLCSADQSPIIVTNPNLHQNYDKFPGDILLTEQLDDSLDQAKVSNFSENKMDLNSKQKKSAKKKNEGHCSYFIDETKNKYIREQIQRYSKIYPEVLEKIVKVKEHKFMCDNFPEMYNKLDNFFLNIVFLNRKRESNKYLTGAKIDTIESFAEKIKLQKENKIEIKNIEIPYLEHKRNIYNAGNYEFKLDTRLACDGSKQYKNSNNGNEYCNKYFSQKKSEKKYFAEDKNMENIEYEQEQPESANQILSFENLHLEEYDINSIPGDVMKEQNCSKKSVSEKNPSKLNDCENKSFTNISGIYYIIK